VSTSISSVLCVASSLRESVLFAHLANVSKQNALKTKVFEDQFGIFSYVEKGELQIYLYHFSTFSECVSLPKKVLCKG
jgi:hypothetical protein